MTVDRNMLIPAYLSADGFESQPGDYSLDPEQIQGARRVIRAFFKTSPKITKRYSAYGLKLIVEQAVDPQTGSISHGAMITAMIAEGYAFLQDEQTAYFNVSVKSVESVRLRSGYGKRSLL